MIWRTTIMFWVLAVCAGRVSVVAAQEPISNSPQAEHADQGHDNGHKQTNSNATAHKGQAGHHDETDLSHQNASAMLEDPSEFRRDLAIWTFVVFLLLLLLLGKFAWRPVMDGLEKREQTIADLVDEARRNAEQTAELVQRHELKMNAAADEAREVVASARRDAETMRERIVSEAQAAAQRERERAVADIQGAKNAALQEMTELSVDIAFKLANGIVRRQLNREDHAQLIRDTLDRFPSVN